MGHCLDYSLMNQISANAWLYPNYFTNDELIIAINTCHLYGVKVYVTINTLIYDI